MLKKDLVTHYLPLIAVMIATIIGFYLFSYDRLMKVSLIIASSVAYFVWGLIHHYIHKDLSLLIVSEYLIVCIFGSVAVLSLIN